MITIKFKSKEVLEKIRMEDVHNALKGEPMYINNSIIVNDSPANPADAFTMYVGGEYNMNDLVIEVKDASIVKFKR